MGRRSRKDGPPIVIRREEGETRAAHHGGAWKVAYADFVTAMMAFFLLMWLINATTEKQRRGLADYFSPVGPTTRAMSGDGKPFGGLTPYEQGKLVSNRGSVSLINAVGRPSATDPDESDVADAAPQPAPAAGSATFKPDEADPDAVPIDGDSHLDGASGRADATEHRTDDDAGHARLVRDAPPDAVPAAGVPGRGAAASGTGQAPGRAAAPIASDPASADAAPDAAADAGSVATVAHDIAGAVAATPGAAGSAGQLSVSVTPQTIRIQIVDSTHKPMFAAGSAMPDARARALLAAVAPVLARLGDKVSVVGHTDDTSCADASCPSNWSLSAARADAARAVLEASGLPDRLLSGVSGLADTEPLPGSAPGAVENRRIVMIVERPRPTAPDR